LAQMIESELSHFDRSTLAALVRARVELGNLTGIGIVQITVPLGLRGQSGFFRVAVPT